MARNSRSQKYSVVNQQALSYEHSQFRVTSRILRLLCAAALPLAPLAGCGHHNVNVPPPSATPASSSTSQPAPPARSPTTGSGSPASGPPPASERQPAIPGAYVEEGTASWYGVPFNGRRTSNGEIYDMHTLTAAHRTLPFNCIVRVTNLDNGKQTEVRINDRGPFVADRVIDLSLAAAQAIEMWGPGTARVRLEILSGSNPQSGFFGVQVGAFKVQENAEHFRAEMDAAYPPATIHSYSTSDGTYYRVLVGKLPSEDAAQKLADRLHNEGRKGALVVRIDD